MDELQADEFRQSLMYAPPGMLAFTRLLRSRYEEKKKAKATMSGFATTSGTSAHMLSEPSIQ